jgi:glutamate-1-semialdehyde 2,1-aminomutase
MAAGLTMLQSLNEDQEVFNRLAAKTAYLHAGMEKVLVANNIVFTINRVGYDISTF